MTEPTIEPTIEPIEAILRDWLEDPDLTLFCGNWAHGGVMELLPRGRARLSGPRYDGEFSGLRDLSLSDGLHHVHLDLCRLTRACYRIAPSVCFGFRPSFEMRLVCEGEDPAHRFGVGLAIGQPYEGASLRQEAIERYLVRAARHLNRYPRQVSFSFSGDVSDATRADWNAIDALVAAHSTLPALRHAPARRASGVEAKA